jgi:hypothetical protein
VQLPTQFPDVESHRWFAPQVTSVQFGTHEAVED